MKKNNGGCKNGFNGRHRNGREQILKKTDFIPISLFKDKDGEKFLHYCSFSRHSSILGSIKARTCQKKGCFYYTRLYETKYIN